MGTIRLDRRRANVYKGDCSNLSRASMNLEPKRILIAEDHAVSRHLLERNLTNWGFQVQAAADGEAAVQVLESENPPSLVILDWMMPKLDGLEVCRRVRARENQPYTYILLLTARNNREELAAAIEAGVDDYLTKPYDPDELRARLKVAQRIVALERHSKAQEEVITKLTAEVELLKSQRSPVKNKAR